MTRTIVAASIICWLLPCCQRAHLHVIDLLDQECQAYLERQQECGHPGYVKYIGLEKTRWIQACIRVSCSVFHDCNKDLSEDNLRLMPICIADIYRSECPFVQIDGSCSDIHNALQKNW